MHFIEQFTAYAQKYLAEKNNDPVYPCDAAIHALEKLDTPLQPEPQHEVVLNQVLVSFGDPEHTRRVIRKVHEEGICRCGGTVWQGIAAMRISVSSWATTRHDIDQSLESVIRHAS